MGGGVSSLPMQVNKETFRQLAGGKFNDFIFDTFAVNGLISRDKLIELSQIKDVYFSFDEGVDSAGRRVIDRISSFGQQLRDRGLSSGGLTNVAADSRMVSSICHDIDKSRCTVFVFTAGYIQQICSAEANIKCKIEFVYSLRKKRPEHLIALVLDETLKDSSRWPPQVLQAIQAIPKIDCTNPGNDAGSMDELFRKVAEHTRNIIVPSQKQERGPRKEEMEENQFFQWLQRSTPISEERRIVYCAAFVQAGITNVHRLAHQLANDHYFLTRLGVNDYDADAIANAVSLLGIGYTYTRDYAAMSTFESALFVLKKAIEAPEDSVLSANALGTSARIAASGPEMVTQMRNAGFCQAIVKVTQSHLADRATVEQACAAIATLCANDDECRDLFGRASVSFFLSRALQGHAESPLAVQNACDAIAALCGHHANKERLGTAGVCEITVRAISRNIAHAGVAVQGCKAMQMLQLNFYANTAKLGNSGGHNTITEILRAHPNNPEVAEAAYLAMTTLALDYDNRSQLGLVVCEPFITSLRNNVRSPVVAALGCRAINQIVVGKASHRDTLGDVGACEAVKLAIETHPTNVDVILFGCQAAYALAKGSQKNLTRFAGLNPVLRSISSRMPSLPQEAKNHLGEAINTIRS